MFFFQVNQTEILLVKVDLITVNIICSVFQIITDFLRIKYV